MATETHDFSKINLTLLATVLAHKAGVQVKVGRHFCCTADTMWIPAGMIGTESEAKLIRGGSCHELVGHIRHTDFTIKGSTKLEQSLYNCLEDIRIERAAWSCYPGARNILEEMAVEVDGRGWFDPPPDDEPESLLLMALLRDLRTRMLLQPLDANKTKDAMTRAIQLFGNRWPDVMRLAEEGATGGGSPDALAAAVKILAIVCNPPPAQQPQAGGQPQESQDSGQDGDEDGDTGQASGDPTSTDDPDGSGDEADSQKQGKKPDAENEDDSPDAQDAKGDAQDGDDSDGQSDNSGDPEEGDSSKSGGSSSKASPDPADEGDGAKSEAGSPSSGGTGQSATPGQSDPSGQSTTTVCDSSVSCEVSLDEMLSAFIAKEMKLEPYYAEATERDLLPNKPICLSAEQRRIANSLSTQLETALFAWTNDEEESSSDRGRFDSTRLTDAYMGDQHSFTRELEDGLDLDTAVYLLVDRSGSTSTIAPAINQALWGVGSALSRYEGSQLEFGIWLFDDNPYPAKRVHARWLRDKGRCNVVSDGSTNWIGSCQPLVKQLALSRKRRKVLFTITDGDLGCADMFDNTVRTATALGVELAFLMIDASRSHTYHDQTLRKVSMTKCYSKDGLQSLQKAIFGALHGSIKPQ